MDQNADPALQFFPEGGVDLYGALGVEKEASQDSIKKAYRKMALRYHPDKVLSNTSTSSIDPHQKFQQIGFAYSVLSDEARRKRYDSTGRTNESMFEQDGFSWDDYFKEMWQGSVSGEKLDEFKRKYQNSDEERADLLEAYQTAEGDLATIFTLVPCSEILEDEERFISLINSAIKGGEAAPLPKWKKTTGDTKGRKTMRDGARKEASEAEEYAKELGVWDDLYGKGRKDGTKSSEKKQKKPTTNEEEVEVVGDVSSDEEEEDDDDDEEEKEEPVQTKKRSKKTAAPTSSSSSAALHKESDGKKNGSASSSKSSKSSSKGSLQRDSSTKGKKASKKSNSAAAEKQANDVDGDDLGGLRALMAKRSQERNQGFNSMIARMEARAQAEAEAKSGGGGSSKNNKKKQGSGGGTIPMFDEPRRGDDEPDEEAFLKAREKIDARKRSKEEEELRRDKVPASGKGRSEAGGSDSSARRKKARVA